MGGATGMDATDSVWVWLVVLRKDPNNPPVKPWPKMNQMVKIKSTLNQGCFVQSLERASKSLIFQANVRRLSVTEFQQIIPKLRGLLVFWPQNSKI
jgi:hypothetical protein